MENDKVTDFPQRLKAWREASGFTQKALAEKLGVALITVRRYEYGTLRPSPEMWKKLTALTGISPHNGEQGQHRWTRIPLSSEEQHFAEEHHALVYSFLRRKRLLRDDWYDICVIAYLSAVQRWFERQDIHEKCSFDTHAFLFMKSAVSYERKKLAHFRVVSLDDIIPGTDGMTYGDTLCDPHDCVRT